VLSKEFGIIYKNLGEEDYFGEIGFFSREERCADVETNTWVTVSYLAINDFIEITKFQANINMIVKYNQYNLLGTH